MADSFYSASKGKTNAVNSRFYTEKDYPLEAINPHFHSRYELAYLDMGSVTIHVNGRTEFMKEGDFALIFPFSTHHYVWNAPFRILFVMFEKAALPSFAEHLDEESEEKAVFLTRPELGVVAREYIPDASGNRRWFFCYSLIYAALGEYLRMVPLREKASRKEMRKKEMFVINVEQHFTLSLILLNMVKCVINAQAPLFSARMTSRKL